MTVIGDILVVQTHARKPDFAIEAPLPNVTGGYLENPARQVVVTGIERFSRYCL